MTSTRVIGPGERFEEERATTRKFLLSRHQRPPAQLELICSRSHSIAIARLSTITKTEEDNTTVCFTEWIALEILLPKQCRLRLNVARRDCDVANYAYDYAYKQYEEHN